MRRHLWWIMSSIGGVIMAAGILIPCFYWDASWWHRLEDMGQEFVIQGWGVGFREAFILTTMTAGEVVVIAGLLASLAGRLRGERRVWNRA